MRMVRLYLWVRVSVPPLAIATWILRPLVFKCSFFLRGGWNVSPLVCSVCVDSPPVPLISPHSLRAPGRCMWG